MIQQAAGRVELSMEYGITAGVVRLVYMWVSYRPLQWKYPAACRPRQRKCNYVEIETLMSTMIRLHCDFIIHHFSLIVCDRLSIGRYLRFDDNAGLCKCRVAFTL